MNPVKNKQPHIAITKMPSLIFRSDFQMAIAVTKIATPMMLLESESQERVIDNAKNI
jgi:hypothetical protein